MGNFNFFKNWARNCPEPMLYKIQWFPGDWLLIMDKKQGRLLGRNQLNLEQEYLELSLKSTKKEESNPPEIPTSSLWEGIAAVSLFISMKCMEKVSARWLGRSRR